MKKPRVRKQYEITDLTFSDGLFHVWYELFVLSERRSRYQILLSLLQQLYPEHALQKIEQMYSNQYTHLIAHGKAEAAHHALEVCCAVHDVTGFDEDSFDTDIQRFINIGRIDEAYRRIDRIISNSDTRREWKKIANAHVQRVILSLHTGNVLEALETVKKAYSLFRRHRDKAGVVSCNMVQVKIIAQKGDLEEVRDLATNACEYYREKGERKHLAECMRFTGYIFSNTGDLDNALKYLNEALKIHREIGYR